MRAWGITDKGKVRQQNQDNYSIQRYPDNSLLCIVCDGMGGAKAGNVASALAVEAFRDCFNEMSGKPVETRLLAAADKANESVYIRSHKDEDCEGMGTTIVALYVTESGNATFLNIGDSRGYRVTEHRIEQITVDHSLVEDLVKSGKISHDQARKHPQKNLITRALGVEKQVKADIFKVNLSNTDYVLLCSDGLSNVVTEQEMLFEIVFGGMIEECTGRLLQIAMANGAPDNVTVVLLSMKETEAI